MRNKVILSVVLLLSGAALVLAGAGWKTWTAKKAEIDSSVIAGDHVGALNAIESLRKDPFFWFARMLPGVNEGFMVQEAWSLYKLGDLTAAVKIFRQLAASEDAGLGSSALFNAATIELTPESFERAISEYEEVLKKNPQHVSAQRNLEILRQLEAEAQKATASGADSKEDADKSDKDDGKEKQRGRSRTKDKLEYRDNDFDGGDKGSPRLRY